jgi:hypothetical protein
MLFLKDILFIFSFGINFYVIWELNEQKKKENEEENFDFSSSCSSQPLFWILLAEIYSLLGRKQAMQEITELFSLGSEIFGWYLERSRAQICFRDHN